MFRKSPRTRQNGFTIIELLIATTIFSVILLLLTFGLLQIGRLYYKGVSSSETQNVARSLADTISQAIQFSDGEIKLSAGPNTYYCFGSKRLSYRVNTELTAGNHVAVIDGSAGGCTDWVFSGPLPAGSQELLTDNMRVLELSVQRIGTTSLYDIRIKIAKGDDDLIIDQANVEAGQAGFVPAQGQCKSGAGSQFCAVSGLYTQVQKRL